MNWIKSAAGAGLLVLATACSHIEGGSPAPSIAISEEGGANRVFIMMPDGTLRSGKYNDHNIHSFQWDFSTKVPEH